MTNALRKAQIMSCKLMKIQINKSFDNAQKLAQELLINNINKLGNYINEHYISVLQIRLIKPIPDYDTDFDILEEQEEEPDSDFEDLLEESDSDSSSSDSSFSSSSESDFGGEISIADPENEVTHIMVVDVETTGGAGPLIQVAYNIYDSDFKCVKKFDCLINENIGRVDWFKKYTLEQIVEDGRTPRDAFKEIKVDIAKCSHVVGHNIGFDMGILIKYFKKLSMVHHTPIRICTMQLSKHLCNLKNVNGGVKAPKLAELYYYCFNCDPDTTKTHTADYDIEITFDVFQHLHNIKCIKM